MYALNLTIINALFLINCALAILLYYTKILFLNLYYTKINTKFLYYTKSILNSYTTLNHISKFLYYTKINTKVQNPILH